VIWQTTQGRWTFARLTRAIDNSPARAALPVMRRMLSLARQSLAHTFKVGRAVFSFVVFGPMSSLTASAERDIDRHETARERASAALRRARRRVDALPPSSPLVKTLLAEIAHSEKRFRLKCAISHNETMTLDALEHQRMMALRTLALELRRIEKIAASAGHDPRTTSSSTHNATGAAGLSTPKTLDDAYAVIGVTQGTPEKAMKKVVDALRMSCHPDLSSDGSDVAQREERTKQINIAWDLIKASLPKANRADANQSAEQSTQSFRGATPPAAEPARPAA
ncbi:MAG: J domain-containing protein, partial [Pseudomonadota bacterium]